MPTRILLADDHAILRLGLKRIIESYPEYEVVAEAATGLEAVQMAERHRPDVALVDIAMKELTGVEATSQILRASPRTAVLILSMHESDKLVHEMLAAGARGYMLKTDAGEFLVAAIEAVLPTRRQGVQRDNQLSAASRVLAPSSEGIYVRGDGPVAQQRQP